MLRIFGQFEQLFIKVRKNEKKAKDFMQQYRALTGCNPLESDGFILREHQSWYDLCEIYFNAPVETVDSLKKLGLNIRPNKMPMQVGNGTYNIDPINFPYSFSDNYWFWKLVQYGYRLGINDNIPYELYQLKEHLRELKSMDLRPIKINHIEAENPTIEAELLAV